MILTYVWVTLSYLFYQATVGGLFFLLAKINAQNPFMTSALLMVEPLLLLLIGIRLAKYIDTLRKSLINTWFYSLLAACTFLGFVCLYLFYQQQASFITLLICYGILSCFFIAERIYRQRLARDFSNVTSIAQSRINAIANLANRGAPVLSPFVLLLFPNGLNKNYVIGFICISLMATISFCLLSKQLRAIPQHLKHANAHSTCYSAEKLGLWHVWHLFLMNLVLGGLFMLLSESMLTGNSLFNFLQGPSIYFAGFWFNNAAAHFNEPFQFKHALFGFMLHGKLRTLAHLIDQGRSSGCA